MVRVRFAPSPTGIPHIGNTRAALHNFLFARHHQGKFILRIEDTDQQRLVPSSLAKLLEILRFIGITWDEGPEVGGPYAPYIQSQRLKLYQEQAQVLVNKKAAYYCFCSAERLKKMRAEQQKKGQLPKYDRHCLHLSPSEIKARLAEKTPYVIRLKVPDRGQTSWQDLIQGKISFQNRLLDDQVLLKSDGYPTYHLAVVVDDHMMKISHILRGVEWISSVPKHLLLYKAFNWSVPQMGHFPLILGPDKAKLSKRHGAQSVLDYRDQGYLPQALITFMAYLGWSYHDNSEILSLDQLIKLYDLKHVQKANPIFDQKKLDYFNAKAIRQLPQKTLLQLIKPFLKLKLDQKVLAKSLPLIQERLVKLTDVNQLLEYFQPGLKADLNLIQTQSQKSSREISSVLGQVQAAYAKLPVSAWQAARLEKIGHQLLKSTAWSPKELFMTLRVGLTNTTATPPLFAIMELLGKTQVLKRLNYAQKKF
jgi:glutamyl-tRNA synthetase